MSLLHRRLHFRSSPAWWLAGGVDPEAAVAVYQPIRAASLAESYINLANPGTNNAAPGTAPTFDAATGWAFDGATQYLTTGITGYGRTWTLLVKFSGATADDGTRRRVLVGASTGAVNRFGVQPWRVSGGVGTVAYLNGLYLFQAPPLASGVLGFAGNTAYRNGVADGAIPDAAILYNPQLLIGCESATGGTPDSFCPVSFQAVAIYSGTLTAAQVAAISAAMAAL